MRFQMDAPKWAGYGTVARDRTRSYWVPLLGVSQNNPFRVQASGLQAYARCHEPTGDMDA